MYIRSFLLFIFIALSNSVLLASSDYRFTHITNKEGLPHQQVEALMQDDKGRIWIGTRNGLSFYDGYNIVSYFYEADNLKSLNHNFVKALYQDSKKRIWIGTYEGICMYQPATDNFKRYNLSNVKIFSILETSSGKIICGGTQLYIYDEKIDEFVMHPRQDSEFIVSMAIDKKDRLYLSTNQSIFYYDASFQNITQLNPAYFSDFITGSDGIIPLFIDSKQNLWISRNGKGVMSIQQKTGEANIYDASKLSNGTVRTIAEDDNGKIWLGTEKGITILNPDGTSEILRQDFVDKNKLNDNAIYSILCDKEGNLWIGTYFGGINIRLKNNEQFYWIEAGYGPKNIRGKAVRKIVEPQNGILWIATEDGGLNIYNSKTGNVSVFDRIPNLGHNIHELFYDDKTKNMWIGTFRNGLFSYNLSSNKWIQYLPHVNNGLPSGAIFSIVKQRNENVWIGTSQGLRYYQPKKNVFLKINHPILDVDFIYCILVDKVGNTWVGTRNSGLFRIDTKTGEVNGWTAKAKNSQLKDNYITSLYQDTKNRIWIGTNNGGLHYIDPVELKIKTPENGLSLSKSTICSIIEDELGRLWISTSQGLYQFNKDRYAFVCYTVQNGLPINQFNFSSSIQAQNGLLYFGSVNGLISFIPKAIKENWKPFHVHFNHLTIDNQIITADSPKSPLTASLDDMSRITFSYNQSRSFSIEYAAISLGNTSTINYQVRLVGVDSDWKNVGKERKFVGSNLPAGTYTLQIRANNSNDGWERSPVKEIELRIRPPFYLSVWAFLVYLMLAMVVLYFSFRIISIRLKEKNAVRLANFEKENEKEINRIKMDFFTAVSHELKTPLSLIVAPLKYIAQHQDMSPESSEKLEIAIKNTNNMVGLIDELVTFNKVESGNFQFYIEKNNPLNFIESLALLFKESAAEKSISIYIHCENNGEDVWFSPSYVEKITSNLLSNAIKFTSAGGQIFINASITDKPDGFNYLHIEVKDTGIGISKDEYDNIFNNYYQTKRGYNTNNKGWGIGLGLVKRFTTIHKGIIAIESEVGKGSCFTVDLNVSESAFDPTVKISSEKIIVPQDQYKFTLPYWDHKTQMKPLSDDSESEKPLLLSSILLVEDNEELLNFLSDIFKDKYNTYLAKNGVEALEIARKYPIDLVISDVMMPLMDGNTLCHNIKEDMSTSHISVILLTAKNDTSDIMKGYESGAEAYIPKPFDPEILELQVKNIIQMKLIQREKISQTLGSDLESTPLNKFDKEFINKINKIIEENISNEEFSVADITKSLYISRSLLHVKMKSLFDTSMGDFIRKKRLIKAFELLREGYNVSETAYQTGFSNPNYFSKVFKKEFGVKPTEHLKIEK